LKRSLEPPESGALRAEELIAGIQSGEGGNQNSKPESRNPKQFPKIKTSEIIVRP
jgi:hypothetical protein